MQYQKNLDNLGKIYQKFGIKIGDESPELEAIMKLSLKIEIVKVAYGAWSNYLKKHEAEEKINNQGEVPLAPLTTLLYLFESYLLQLRICMDFWAKFFKFIPGYQDLGHSFNKHKANVINLKDHQYSEYVQGMEWFTAMKNCRDEFKRGDIRIILYNPKLDGLVIYGLGNYFKKNKDKEPTLVRGYTEKLNDDFIKYCKFVFTHFLE